MKKTAGFTLVEIMIVVAIIATLAALAIPNILRSKMNANEALARKTLNAMAQAAEMYNATNSQYPNSMNLLTGAAPPYLSTDYCWRNISGYMYACTIMSTSQYLFMATPVLSNGADGTGKTGNNAYRIDTGLVKSYTTLHSDSSLNQTISGW